MPTLALDTSTAGPALALTEGPEPLAELTLEARPGAGRRVLQAVHGLLAAADLTARQLDRVVVGVGPGGFTGLRIGIATALGLGQALEIPVAGASSLEALAVGMAAELPAGATVVPAFDARRREVFVAAYRAEGGARLAELLAPRARGYADAAAELTAVASPEHPAATAGDGVAAAAGHWSVPHLVPMPASSRAHRLRAAALAARVDSGAGRPAAPDYARLPDAEVNRRRALAESPGGGE